MREIVVTVLGEPVAQGRPRFSRFAGPGRPMLEHPRAIDPKKSSSWKRDARAEMLAARGGGDLMFPDGPLRVHVLAVFSCPKGDWRKASPVPRRPHAKRPDAENVAKAVLDACSEVIFRDDAQVAELVIEKVIAAQGEAPFVRVTVREWPVRECSSVGESQR